MIDEKERTRALQATLGQIEKQFGKGSIVRLGSKEAYHSDFHHLHWIYLGGLRVGRGWFPRGRINEIFRTGIVR